MATETKMGLGIIFILIVAFSFVVWKKVEHQKKMIANGEMVQPTSTDEPSSSTDDKNTLPEEKLVEDQDDELVIAELDEETPNNQVSVNSVSVTQEKEVEPVFSLEEDNPLQEEVAENKTEQKEDSLDITFEETEEEPSEEIANTDGDFFDEPEQNINNQNELLEDDNEFIADTDLVSSDVQETEFIDDELEADTFDTVTKNDESLDFEEPISEIADQEIALDDEPNTATEMVEEEPEFDFEAEEEPIQQTYKEEVKDVLIANDSTEIEEYQNEPIAQNEEPSESEEIDLFDEPTEQTSIVKDIIKPVPRKQVQVHVPESIEPSEPEISIHVVRNNDNFWSIAKQAYGSSRYFRALAAYNKKRIPDPKKMRSGMKVIIPSRSILEQKHPQLIAGFSKKSHRVSHAVGTSSPSVKKPSGFHYTATGTPYFRIGGKDTLTRIAKHHLGRSSRWIQIYELNRSRLKNPHDLKIGTELRLPADASQVRLVNAESETR